MQAKQLVDLIHDRCRHGRGDSDKWMCAGISKKEVGAVLHYLGEVILEEVILKADRVNLPGLGTAHAEWLGKNGKKSLYAQFDWAPNIEKRILEEKPNSHPFAVRPRVLLSGPVLPDALAGQPERPPRRGKTRRPAATPVRRAGVKL